MNQPSETLSPACRETSGIKPGFAAIRRVATLPIDVVLPVHNEGGSIAQTLEEFHRVVAEKSGVSIRFVICEDGSRDNTVAAIKTASERLPIELLTSPERKGYSRAVIDGLRATKSPLVSFIDSDGQCDPHDFQRLLDELTRTGSDLVVGYRAPRRDHWSRLLMSSLFRQAYQLYFRVGLKDPSCPYLIIRREALERVLDGNVGILKQGFWWEFYARARAKKLRIRQVPVRHRTRAAGTSVVYRPGTIPGIAWAHLRGLARLSRELKAAALR